MSRRARRMALSPPQVGATEHRYAGTWHPIAASTSPRQHLTHGTPKYSDFLFFYFPDDVGSYSRILFVGEWELPSADLRGMTCEFLKSCS